MKKNESWKRMVAGVLALTLVTGVAPLETVPGSFFDYYRVVVNAEDVVNYQKASFDRDTLTTTFTQVSTDDYVLVSADNTEWKNGTYVVSGEVSIDTRITVSGEVNLVLCDGAKLNANKGITVLEGNTLNIFGQENETGALYAYAVEERNYDGPEFEEGNKGAAIGGYGGYGSACGKISIHGGNVNTSVNGIYDVCAIGGGYYGKGGIIEIFGGTVIADGSSAASSPGIGGREDAGTVLITGGNVTAKGGEWSAGIGGSFSTPGGNVEIYGGTVTANGSGGGMGIGRGGSSGTYDGSNGTLKTGNNVVVKGGNSFDDVSKLDSPYDTRYQCMNSLVRESHTYTVADIEFTEPWESTTSLPSSPGNYYLTEDITMNECLSDPPGGINIYLNGHKITGPETNVLLGWNNNASDSETVAFYGTGQDNEIITGTKLAYINGGTLLLHNVMVTGFDSGADLNGGSGHIAKLVMKGGAVITGCKTAVKAGNGSAVDIYDGEIINNQINIIDSPASFNIKGKAVILDTIQLKNNKITVDDGASLTGNVKIKLSEATDTTKPLSGTPYSFVSGGADVADGVFSSADNYYVYIDENDNWVLSVTPETSKTVTFFAGEHGISPDKQKVRVGKTAKEPEIKTDSIDWKFAGWYKNEECTGTAFNFNSTIYRHTKLYAKWIESPYVISLPENGMITANGTRGSENDTVVLRMKSGYTLPEGMVPLVKNGEKEIGVTVNKDGSYSFIMPAGDVEVSVSEESITKAKYTVTTSENITSDTEMTTVGEKVKFKIDVPENKAVKKFTVKCDGNELSAGLQKIDYDEYELTMPAGNVTVDVEFADIAEYTVIYFGDDISEVRLTSYGLSDESKMEKDVDLNGQTAWSTLAEAAEAENMQFQFKKSDDSWSEPKNIAVIEDINKVTDNLTALENGGKCAVVKGDTNMVGVVFNHDEKESASSIYRFTLNGSKVTAPEAVARKGYEFQYWTDQKGNHYKAGDDVSLADYKGDKVISLNAEWKKSECKLSFAMNGAKEKIADQTLKVGTKAVKPVDPTKEGHAFVKWVVAANSGTYTKGETFDFNKPLTDDVTVKAEWKHVHSYSYYTLDAPVFEGAFKEYCTEKYLSAIHVKMCSKWDDYAVEAHQFDKNGKCACGYQKKVEKVKVTIWGNTVEEKQIDKNTAVQLSAPEKDGNKVFWCWGYSFDGSSYKVLCESRNVSVTVPCDLHLHPFYKDPPEEPKPEAKVSVTKTTQGLSFLMQYKLPEGCKATDCVIKVGNNYRIHYFRPYVLSPKSNIVNSFTSLVGKGRDTNYHVFGNPSTWDVMAGKVTVYYDVNDNVIDKIGKTALRDKMYASKGVTVGNTELLVKKASSLGRSGGVYFNLTPSSRTEINYAMGYVNYIDKNGKSQVLVVDPIAATYDNPNLTK